MVIKVMHLLPKDGLGGAETAARSMRDLSRPGFSFRLQYIVEPTSVASRGFRRFRIARVNNPLAHLVSVYRIVVAHPDVLIASLWPSMPVAMLMKVLRPRMKLVVFLHSALPAHAVDNFLTLLALKICDEVWADSAKTLESRVGQRADTRRRVISFVVARTGVRSVSQYRGPRFVFWGRLTHDKGIDVALKFIRLIREKYPNAKFDIWGPDKGERANIEAQIKNSGLEGVVRLMGELDRSEISAIAAEYSFYLQLSRREGMAMSVVEAMQQGLVPVVTAVGQIGSYCKPGMNSLIVDPEDLGKSVEDLDKLIQIPGRFEDLSASAFTTWADAKEYGDDVLEGIAKLMQR
ncbi:glycosyltransferase [Mesorhizobium sp. C280B]|uniref:glycosyltransferase family 4 protein n=1 Tax=unclassified Mesorhizobium TaxID=325217 RepID=UPI0018DB8719|nr:glycosyltransferase [Mesorhizobium sp. LSJC280B00]